MSSIMTLIQIKVKAHRGYVIDHKINYPEYSL